MFYSFFISLKFIKALCFWSLVPYILHHGVECFLDNTIHKISAELEFENCKQWCTDNNQCGGFTIYKDECYFKNQSCKNNLVNFGSRMTFTKM